RSTGSGMGCPDWPKCFDQYVPPTSASQLPSDYKEKYVAERVAKNERFAKTLERMGKAHLADSIRHDPSILLPETFNVAKTWTEYLNRLMGALTGFLLLILTVYSFAYRKTARRIVVLSILNLLVVGYQGWLGSIVVSTNLMPWIVTVHMLLAVLIICILIYTYHYAKHLHKENSVIMAKLPWLKGFLLLTLLTSLIQIVVGTEVREAIDVISKDLAGAARNSWIAKAGSIFIEHRNLAILVLVFNIVVYKMVKDRFNGKAEPLKMANWIALTLFVQLLSGFALAYLSLPPVAQAVHILFAVLLFGIQYYLYLLVYRTSTYKQ
ncbi:MAG: heme A synthase, partial [Pedobacter sp.]